MGNILSGLVLVNGTDIWTEYGVFLVEDRRGGMENLTAILTPSKAKKDTAVDIREEHGEKYSAVSLTRELEGAVQAGGDVSPRSALYLSRGTLDQLYLSVRLAVCQLCLPERPPIILDDALTAFDDQRLPLALELLRELARDRQILLFSCQRREGELAARWPEVTRLSL